MGVLKQAGKKSKLPTALFIANDEMALGTLRALHYAGIRVPQEVALVNVGDTRFTTHTAPALTSLAHPVAEAGKIAAHLLLEQFPAHDPLPAPNIMLTFDLHIAQSSGSNPETSCPFF